MEKNSIWKNQAFCFRISIVFILVWLVISYTISLTIYFSFDNDFLNEAIIQFSTCLFIFPAIIIFGLINAVPLILDWLLEPFKTLEDNINNSNLSHMKNSCTKMLSSGFENTSDTMNYNLDEIRSMNYSQLASQLDINNHVAAEKT